MLRYLWIKDYKNIQETGFQFDPALEVIYDPVTGILEVNRRPERALPTGFFGLNVQLVTGVLGENGAGKSALMEFLRSVAGSFGNGESRMTPPCLFIFDNTIINQASILISNIESLRDEGYSTYTFNDYISYNQIYISSRNAGVINPINQHLYIYYSNFWESSSLDSYPAVIDVSTTYTIEGIHGRNQFRGIKQDSLISYWTHSFIWEIRMLHYLRSNTLEHMPFSLPRLLSLRTKDPSEVYQIRELNDEFFEENKAEKLKSWFREFESRLGRNNQSHGIEEFINRFILPRLLLLMQSFPQDFARLNDAELSNLSSLEQRPPRMRKTKLQKQLDTLYEFVTFLREAAVAEKVLTLQERIGFDEPVVRTVQLDTTALPQERLVRLLSHLSYMSQTFDARWFGLSSGQAAYLRLHARMYQALTEVKERAKRSFDAVSTVTILIDEGETGFHPQWQKQYVQLLLSIVSKMFAAYQVQLIIGSNSAFIASDIPKSNLLLLHRRKAGNRSEVRSYSGKEETFAANIHTLLTDSFFLQDGLMGDFARAKVNALIQYLQQEGATQDGRRGEMKAIMEMIGEPVIRMKLREMWNSKFGIQEEIDDLERRLEQLRGQRGNGQDRA
ncbi:hypothetical protein FNT36_22145 [Hymenobacter setariae]|uniref:ATPase AAA-type core domain-containing protein n=1 Tax=Hymenobacter setariae TaxID=2594794 RepID=A0A558BMZ5_9BACT|nr:hypothetical protein [Hymenobacter setariae]TVT37863.1 hypothetical protein FNT36_22145 [Hymenobacter setariae]